MPFLKGIFFASLLLCTLGVQGQFLDSIKTSFSHKPKFDARIDLRNSFITTQLARIVGFKIGLDYNKTVKIGIGYNVLWTDLMQVRRTELKKLRFNYISPYMVYTYYKKDNWELSIPVHLGIGTADYVDQDVSMFGMSGNPVVVYEPYMTAQYRLLKYFGVGVGMGFRLLLVGNSRIDQNFNSPIYVFKGKIFLNDIFNDLRK